MKFTNPILNADYSDPDIIKGKNGYYLISSSFNYVPGIPVLYSKDLVNYKLVNYVIDKLPTFYNKVRPSNGVWAPSIKYNNGVYYCFIPFPDKGIYYSTCKNPIKDKWSKLKPLLLGKGYEDPTVLFENGKAYLIFAFVKSRIGFNSKLGLIEFNEGLTKRLTKDYKIIFDGTNSTPVIEGPKVYKIRGYYYIFAPAFGVEHGKQLILRSKNIYGPYEYKIVLEESKDINMNGPHQGGLVHINKNNYAFIHFSYDDFLGRVVNLEPAIYNPLTKWFELGNNGYPIINGEIQTKEHNEFKLNYSDNFKSKKLNLIWQTPGNVNPSFTKPTSKGLILNTQKKNKNICIRDFTYVLSQKFSSNNFISTLKFNIKNLKDNCSFGFTILGKKYMYILLTNKEDKTIVSFYSNDNSSKDKLEKSFIFNKIVESEIKLDYSNSGLFSISLNNTDCKFSYSAIKEHYIGLRIGIFTYGNNLSSSVKLLDYKIKEK